MAEYREWTSSKLQSWRKMRVNGRQYYAFRQGLLLRGSILFLILLTGVWMIRPSGAFLFVMIFLFALMSYSLGYIAGVVNWNHNEKIYQNIQNRDRR
jgi:hypothetical protein